MNSLPTSNRKWENCTCNPLTLPNGAFALGENSSSPFTKFLLGGEPKEKKKKDSNKEKAPSNKEKAPSNKEKAYSKWESKGHYEYDEEEKSHKVWCYDNSAFILNTYISSSNNTAPILDIDIPIGFNPSVEYLICTVPDEGEKGELIKITLDNGEIISSSETGLFKGFLGMELKLILPLTGMKSDKHSLQGDLDSVKYLVDQLSNHNILEITIKGETIVLNNIDTKGQLCYDFYRLAEESRKSYFLP